MNGKIFPLRAVSSHLRRLLIALALTFAAPAAQALSVLIVQTGENDYYRQTLQALTDNIDKGVEYRVFTGKALPDDNGSGKTDLVIMLGQIDANQVAEGYHKTPVIYSYITQFQWKQSEHLDREYALVLDQPIKRYLNFIAQLVGTRKVGILHTWNNQLDPEHLQQLSSQLDLTVDQRLLADQNPVNAVRNILEDNDVLLSLPDPKIYNRNSLKGILLTSYRQNKPVISYSPAHARSGALAAIFSSPVHIGEQLAEIINRINQNGKLPEMHLIYPTRFEVEINNSVARSMDLELPDIDLLFGLINQDSDL